MTSIRCSVYFAAVAAALLVPLVSGLTCPICRTTERWLTNPGHKFTMSNGQGATADWTCGFLEESVADVNPANEGEGFFCALAQVSTRRLAEWESLIYVAPFLGTMGTFLYVSSPFSPLAIYQTWAERECDCAGPPIIPFQDQVIDPNPKCNMCRDDRTVPFIQREELVQTGIAGRMACGGLYDALAKGVLPANLCPEMQANTADFCCEVPLIAAPPTEAPVDGGGGGGGETCIGLYDNCESAACCSEFDCKLRNIDSPPICSARPRAVKTSLAVGRGGAGAAAKFGS
jgi:hypothetical protein